jgi:Phage tail protein
MLTMVTAQRIQSGILLLPLADSSAGYIVRDIQGLDPVKATLASSAYAQQDGGQLHNARREARNITMKIGLKPDYVSTSVRSLRSGLYHFFMPKSLITFSLYDDDVLWGTTEAVVESCENNMFTDDPQVDISIMCYDPDFYAPEVTHIDSATVSDTTTQEIDYEGTSDTGIEFALTFPADSGEIRLYNTRPDNVLNLVILQGSFLANDVLKVNSNQGRKSIVVSRGGMNIPSLYYLDRRSSWVSLEHGVNLFRAYYSGSAIPFTLDYTARYGGF